MRFTAAEARERTLAAKSKNMAAEEYERVVQMIQDNTDLGLSTLRVKILHRETIDMLLTDGYTVNLVDSQQVVSWIK
jgi:hypothetical protein